MRKCLQAGEALYRLIDDLAAQRRTYPAPIPTLPQIVLIDLPGSFRGSGLLFDRYYAVIAESPNEVAEFEGFLAAPRAGPIIPDLLDRRTSAIVSGEVMIAGYAPPEPGWPWLSLCRWPDDWISSQATLAVELARGHYSFEAFECEDQLEEHQIILLTNLRYQSDLRVRFITTDALPPGGLA